MHFNKILITTAFSDDANLAFELAAYERKMENSEIILLNVCFEWEIPVGVLDYVPDPMLVAKYKENVEKEAKQKLQSIKDRYFHNQNVKCEVIMTSEPAAKSICDYASKHKCEVIIISSHGQGALSTLILGSVVQKVLQNAPCPVLVVPRGKKQK